MQQQILDEFTDTFRPAGLGKKAHDLYTTLAMADGFADRRAFYSNSDGTMYILFLNNDNLTEKKRKILDKYFLYPEFLKSPRVTLIMPDSEQIIINNGKQ